MGDGKLSGIEEAVARATKTDGEPTSRCECGGASWYDGDVLVSDVHRSGCGKSQS